MDRERLCCAQRGHLQEWQHRLLRPHRQLGGGRRRERRRHGWGEGEREGAGAIEAALFLSKAADGGSSGLTAETANVDMA